MWTERSRLSDEARATVRGPHGFLKPAVDHGALASYVPQRVVPVAGELAVLAVTWMVLALAEAAILLLLDGGWPGNWGWVAGLAVYNGGLQWWTLSRPSRYGEPRPLAAAEPDEISRVRLIWTATWTAVVVLVFAGVLALLVDDGALMVAIQLGFAIGASVASGVLWRQVRHREQRLGAELLRPVLWRLRLDGRRPTLSERRAVGQLQFAATR